MKLMPSGCEIRASEKAPRSMRNRECDIKRLEVRKPDVSFLNLVGEQKKMLMKYIYIYMYICEMWMS